MEVKSVFRNLWKQEHNGPKKIGMNYKGETFKDETEHLWIWDYLVNILDNIELTSIKLIRLWKIKCAFPRIRNSADYMVSCMFIYQRLSYGLWIRE